MFVWQSVYIDTTYHVRHILIFPAATIQLPLTTIPPSISHTVVPRGRNLFCIYILTPLLLLRTYGTKFATATCETICPNCIKPLVNSSVLPPPKLIVFSLCQSLLLMVVLDKTSFLHFSKLYETDFIPIFIHILLHLIDFIKHYFSSQIVFCNSSLNYNHLNSPLNQYLYHLFRLLAHPSRPIPTEQYTSSAAYKTPPIPLIPGFTMTTPPEPAVIMAPFFADSPSV